MAAPFTTLLCMTKIGLSVNTLNGPLFMPEPVKGVSRKIHLAGFILAISIPLGYYLAHTIVPILWWIEVKTLIALLDQTGPSLVTILFCIILCWVVLYSIISIIIEWRKRQRGTPLEN